MTRMLWNMTSLTLLPSRFRFRRGWVTVSGRMVVANAYSSNNFTSRQLYCMKLSYEKGSHRNGRGDYGVVKCFCDKG